MKGDLFLLVKKSPHKIFDAYTRANTIDQRVVGGPKDRNQQIVEGNIDWWVLGGLEALN